MLFFLRFGVFLNKLIIKTRCNSTKKSLTLSVSLCLAAIIISVVVTSAANSVLEMCLFKDSVVVVVDVDIVVGGVVKGGAVINSLGTSSRYSSRGLK